VIFEAICDGDSVGAAEVMAEHLDHAREQLREIVFGPARGTAG
jgi:DNA-binding GntR family transcriptional regulator